MSKNRQSGILLPIYALPSPYGIGTLGKAAYDFIDYLNAAGQSVWQILPAGPTSYGDSPYQSFSTFAGNPYFIDLDALMADGLLTRAEVLATCKNVDPRYINYGDLYYLRFPLLAKAAARGILRDKDELDRFIAEQHEWLPDYALFMAVKKRFGDRAWTEWEDEDIRLRRPEALERYTEELASDIRFYEYLQFLFFRQWARLKDYAHSRGVKIFGDLPIYVAMDSADVWANTRFFQMDEQGRPSGVAGVPPDYFSEDGQLWGNPLYNWDAMADDGYGWWIRRIAGAERLYDIIRIDHFRAFSTYWSIPYGEKTAKHGEWKYGPGMRLIGMLQNWFPQVELIAEDLGDLSADVYQLLDACGLPGMKVLEFAFDNPEGSDYLPHNYPAHCVSYVGTHDNATAEEWAKAAPKATVERAKRYFAVGKNESLSRAMIRGGMSSVAELFVAQMQDWLGYGTGSRTNVPGTMGLNWRWRLLPNELKKVPANEIREMTALYGRLPADGKEKS